MKTVEQEIKERYEFPEYCNDDLADQIQAKRKAFKCGVLFAQRWIPIEQEQPTHNSWVLVKTDLCRFPCQVCQVRLDKFISTDNFIVANITHWRPISFLQ